MNNEIPSEKLDSKDIGYLLDNSDVPEKDTYFRANILYLHAPNDGVHLAFLQKGDLHKKLRRLTFSIFLANSPDYVAKIVCEQVHKWVEQVDNSIFITNLFDEIRPLLIQVFFELLFGEEILEQQRPLYTQAVENIHNTFKGMAIRSIPVRLRMVEDVKQQVAIPGRLRVSNKEDLEEIDTELLARHVSAIFFDTAVIQTTELLCHTLVEIYRQPEIRDKLQHFIDQIMWPPSLEVIEQYDYLDYVVKESLRLFPAVGRFNRQFKKTVTVKDITFEEDSIFFLKISRSHKLPWDDPESFKPNRWDDTSPQATPEEVRNAHFIPFGTGSRKCPAATFAPNMIKTAIVAIMKYTHLTIPDNFVHTRSIPRGVPVVFALSEYGHTLRPNMEPSPVCVGDLIVQLEQKSRLDYEGDELAGMSVLGIARKIANNLKYFGDFRLEAFSPLITGIDVWSRFQVKQIQKYLGFR